MKKGKVFASRWFFIFLFGLVLFIGGAISAGADVVVYNSWNADGTYNNPPIDPVFTLDKPTTITTILNYHWNNWYGQDASLVNGWIGIEQILSETESVSAGKWPAVSGPGAFGSQNTQWYAYPDTVIGPGTFRVVDSDRATWSYTVTDYFHYLGYTGKEWAPYKGFSMIFSADSPAACIQPPSGMTGWWPGDGNATDIAGPHNGAIQGNVTYAQGRVADAFSFNRQGYVSVPDDDVWTLGANPFTVDLWVKFNSLSGRDPFVAHDEGGGWTNKWIFWYDAYAPYYGHYKGCYGPSLAFHINSPSMGPIDPICTAWQPETGRWYLVAVTRNGNTYSLYIDGVLVKTAEDSNSIADPNFPLTIGRAEAYLFDGQIDEVEIFNRALTAEEMQAIYNAGSAGKCKNVNHPPVAEAGPDQTVEMTSCAGAVVTLDGSGSSDPDGDTLTYTWTWPGGSASGVNPTVTLPYGNTTVTLTVDDGKGGTATDTVDISVVDTTAPTLNVTVTPNLLWPPNHKYVKVTPSVSVSDACAATTTVELVSVTSNEPDNGLGDGDTANDIIVNPDGTLSLRAERSGTGSGRIYTITYKATDIAGNSVTASATVTVPHNMGDKK